MLAPALATSGAVSGVTPPSIFQVDRAIADHLLMRATLSTMAE
jgi:hypothetical protein